ncbi:M23 family metallopeptidase [Actinoplanes sp. NEAU-A12]|uniref:M23 family metallopeptidase n=1 Tax=Actinoplanes sandaracinus TaxID=3045177 RepID=A0ABT6WD44_9ACTN|nr:M23 family metallopeptidase [Actinoplanes sandaracinus]MDI6097623.1 M23 family metallopeptidase [Actinoplanes sandaracinus]
MPVPAVVALLPLFLLPGPPVAPSSPSPAALRAADAAYRWPVVPPRVVRRFEPPAQRWLPGHRGVDLESSAGAVVRAAAGGVVVYAQALAGRGVVSVAHAGQLRTTYEPVTATVRIGDHIAAGDPIGTVETGHPGCAADACLHWGLRRGEVYLDPLALLGFGRVRLLPLDGR